MKKIDFFPRAIDCNTWLQFNQAHGPGRIKKYMCYNQEKSAAHQGAENGRFCMGILVTLSLSKKKAPIGIKIFF